jgi:hypothetical protein
MLRWKKVKWVGAIRKIGNVEICDVVDEKTK